MHCDHCLCFDALQSGLLRRFHARFSRYASGNVALEVTGDGPPQWRAVTIDVAMARFPMSQVVIGDTEDADATVPLLAGAGLIRPCPVKVFPLGRSMARVYELCGGALQMAISCR